MPDEHVAFASCHPVGIDMCARKDLGLSPVSRDSASHVIHCGVAGAKTPLIFVGPAVGLLYAVVQGTLLLLSWPGTERNFDVWYRVSRGIPLDTPNIFFCLKEPHINVLRTGDAFHLPAGTVTFMMALSHVGMVSREILNPDPTEINNIVNLSNRMMDFFIAQQNIRYSGLDHVEVQRIENNKAFWDQIVGEIRKRKVPRQEHQPDEHTVENVRKDIQEVGLTLKVLTRGMQKVGKKIRRYYKMVEAGRPRARPEGCSCPRGRQDETRDAVGGVVSTAGGSSASSSSDSDHSSSDHLSKCVKSTNKGKCRVHD
ncbi:hypothetical protein NDA16_003144 [Ustilago loliicola]|nr:hypothetical protein NDA16_003144 [Ustilago loliicola]